MENKQTAVEWVLQYLNNVKPNEFCSIEKIKEILEQAKEMEKEQIMDAHYAPKYGCFNKDYYEQTYGGNK
jgi:hypothetical protein